MPIVAHNLLAQFSYRQLNINTKSKEKSTEKLSSGYKINRAADDAAHLAISEKMRSQIRGLNKGIKNTQEGVSLCQVADGALAEVNSILQRVTELSVKAANGTNTPEDRQAIQQEIRQLLTEVDRIGDTTTFNTQRIFKDSDRILQDNSGPNMNVGDIPMEDYSLADLGLGMAPFGPNSRGNELALRAIVTNPDSPAYAESYDLLFGNGGTSSPSLRVTQSNGMIRTIDFNNLTANSYNYDATNNVYSRTFQYQDASGLDLTIKQNVDIDDANNSEKNYLINYEVTNNSADKDLTMEFMFHADTAYRNNDMCEGYYIEGQRIDKTCVYSDVDSPYTAGVTSDNIKEGIPSSFSIVDVDDALAFSVKIATIDGNKPESVSIGRFDLVRNWNYYNNLGTNSSMGQNTNLMDLGFSFLWKDTLSDTKSTVNYGFKYGISATETDRNLQSVDIQRDPTPVEPAEEKGIFWIQSGYNNGDGLFLEFDAMDSGILGIRDIDLSTEEGASNAITLVGAAIDKVCDNRSKIGAQQNRLEHIIANESNIVENTTDAESRIRDTDMASEMVQLSKKNILSQVSESMLAQANRSSQDILSLLQ